MSESNIDVSPGSIFICYRREDSADATGRIYDRLADHFGSERVFIDVEAIRLGYDFRSEIDQTIKVCSMVIVVIGDQWLAQVEGKRRIDDENDRVRLEIEAALRREIPIIPVLVRGASHPTKAMLPSSLEPLAYRHGTSIRHEHFRGDVDFLISQVAKLRGRHESTPSKPAKPKEPQETETDATSGDATAQNALGLRYQNGEGVPKDLRKAAELYQKAADQGYALAQNNLGLLYENGWGVPKDLHKAAELYQKAADQGYALAQNNLGLLYENGWGRAEGFGERKRTLSKSSRPRF